MAWKGSTFLTLLRGQAVGAEPLVGVQAGLTECAAANGAPQLRRCAAALARADEQSLNPRTLGGLLPPA